MAALFLALLIAILNSLLYFVESAVDSLAPMAFRAELAIGYGFSVHTVTRLFNVALNYGVALIILKFLKKGFEAYTLWTDGDPDMDPLILLTNFFKALAVALSFGVAYNWICDVAMELLGEFLVIIDTSAARTITGYIANLVSLGLFDALMSLIFFIFWLVLYLQFFMRGIEMMILRVGIPFACLGLLDNDKGVFKPYIQKFFQNALTVIVQVVLIRLGLALMLNNHAVWGVACMMTALATPKFLQEFMIAAGGGSNVSGTVYQTARLGQMVKGLLKKAPVK